MRWNRAAHLHKTAHAMTVNHNLFCFDFVGNVTVEISATLQKARTSKTGAAPSDQTDVNGTTENTDIYLGDEAVDYLECPIAV